MFLSRFMKMYRFFYHYRRSANAMTVHFRGKCIPCKHVKCEVPCETKWHNKQTYLTMQGFCKDVIIENDVAIIRGVTK